MMHSGSDVNTNIQVDYELNNEIHHFYCSPQHYVHQSIDGISAVFKFASEIQVGNYIWVLDSSSRSYYCLITHTLCLDSLVPVQAIQIKIVQLEGYYAPLTETGTIIVDGVAASVYAGPWSVEAAAFVWRPMVLNLFNFCSNAM